MMKKKCTWIILMCVICILFTACSTEKGHGSFEKWKEDAEPITRLLKNLGSFLLK